VALRLAVVAFLLALDLWSKHAVFAYFDAHPERLVRHDCGNLRLPIAGDWLAFMLSRNPGMAWGLEWLSPYVLVLGRAAAAVWLAWLLVRTPSHRRWLAASLTLILAGALGNLHDNVLLHSTRGRPFGEVRDLIDLFFARWDYHFETFNVADSCIFTGAVLLLAFGLRTDRARSPAGSPASSAASPKPT
jgi:signal peptidase II